ncbi:MAG: sigma-70 family RNA polymerase sigma factor [Oscillospiraceae bacterium]|nr:sigma-70 family RNA polymerase sigma factor [Oscillospiraceae bacterium]
MDDASIIALYFARDEHAIRETADRFGPACMTNAMRILGCREEAEECVNDTYFELWRTIPPQRPEHLTAFILTIVRHLAMNRIKHKQAKKRGGGSVQLALEELDNILPAEDDVQGQTEKNLTAEAINRFLATLPKDQRIIFLRRYWHFQSAKEIASALGLTESNVRVTLMRLRTKLKEYLEKEDLL